MSIFENLVNSKQSDSGSVVERKRMLTKWFGGSNKDIYNSPRLRALFAKDRYKYQKYFSLLISKLNKLRDDGNIRYYVGGCNSQELASNRLYCKTLYEQLFDAPNLSEYKQSVLNTLFDPRALTQETVDDILKREREIYAGRETESELLRHIADGGVADTRGNILLSKSRGIHAHHIETNINRVLEVISKTVSEYVISTHFTHMLSLDNYNAAIHYFSPITPLAWDIKIFIVGGGEGIETKINNQIRTFINNMSAELTKNTSDLRGGGGGTRSGSRKEKLERFTTRKVQKDYDYFTGTMYRMCMLLGKKNKETDFSDEGCFDESVQSKEYTARTVFNLKIINSIGKKESIDRFIENMTRQVHSSLNDNTSEMVPMTNRIGIEFEIMITISKILEKEREANVVLKGVRSATNLNFPNTESRNMFYNTTRKLSQEELKMLVNTALDSNLPYDIFEQKSIIEEITKNVLTLSGDSKKIETAIVNDLRPYINSILALMRVEMNKLTEKIKEGKDEYADDDVQDIEKIDLFIVGGDAIGRFIPSTTGYMSDIDVKLFLTPKSGRGGKNMSSKLKKFINSKITECLSQYVVLLRMMFKYNAELKDSDSKVIHKFRLRRGDFYRPWSMNEKDIERGKYIIYSIDSMSEINLENSPNLMSVLTPNSLTLSRSMSAISYQFAVLDISINYNADRININELYDTHNLVSKPSSVPKIVSRKKFTIEEKKSEPILNIATKKFLIDDIEKRYEFLETALPRYMQGKLEKDLERYIELNRGDDVYYERSLDILNMYVYEFFTKYRDTDAFNILSQYACLYGKEFEVSVGKRYTKMPFSSGYFIMCDKDDRVINEYKKFKGTSSIIRKKNRISTGFRKIVGTCLVAGDAQEDLYNRYCINMNYRNKNNHRFIEGTGDDRYVLFPTYDYDINNNDINNNDINNNDKGYITTIYNDERKGGGEGREEKDMSEFDPRLVVIERSNKRKRGDDDLGGRKRGDDDVDRVEVGNIAQLFDVLKTVDLGGVTMDDVYEVLEIDMNIDLGDRSNLRNIEITEVELREFVSILNLDGVVKNRKK